MGFTAGKDGGMVASDFHIAHVLASESCHSPCIVGRHLSSERVNLSCQFTVPLQLHRDLRRNGGARLGGLLLSHYEARKGGRSAVGVGAPRPGGGRRLSVVSNV